MIIEKPTNKQLKALWDMVADFIEENEIGFAETIYQMDKISEVSLDFIYDLCETVGYYDDEDDSEDVE